MSGWQRYWLQLWESSLVYFSPKALTKGVERHAFRSEPCKFHSIAGWLVMVAEGNLLDNLSFQLTDPVQRNVYRFRAPTPQQARAWAEALHAASRAHITDPSAMNLITFE
jgi:hypothetical protein